MVLVPDTEQKKTYDATSPAPQRGQCSCSPRLTSASTDQPAADVDVAMVAPKAPAPRRRTYVEVAACRR